ncbi:tyrosine-protein phosphatase [Algimonas porphyrae]|uniref:Protein-tyrosine-phosphatase n=1 Tax=Algimonas porphyrae TaxID=1128113 RepID=A0ABQ5UYE7_9PROT|nr:tyrosine-protein phosphatase [Algimonas porphyrae]GLQ19944.1 protein-tyrosine-phosphatase [Algimonas porphyrae]
MSLIDVTDRLKPYGSIYNFRDFGGYSGLGGQSVRTGVLFRSAHLNGLSEADQAEIDALTIGTVVDLRHAPERKRQPSKWPENEARAAVLTQPVTPELAAATVAPHEAFAEQSLYSAQDARDYMTTSYRNRPHDAGFMALFSDTLTRMTEPQVDQGEGVLVHCAAGKDRTGTLVALIQGLLGVSDGDIMADYMLTETAVDIEAFLEPAAAMFSQRYGRTIDADSLRPMFGVEPDYLSASLEAMGDMERYAVDTLGLDGAQLDRLRARYLTNGHTA